MAGSYFVRSAQGFRRLNRNQVIDELYQDAQLRSSQVSRENVSRAVETLISALSGNTEVHESHRLLKNGECVDCGRRDGELMLPCDSVHIVS